MSYHGTNHKHMKKQIIMKIITVDCDNIKKKNNKYDGLGICITIPLII